MHLNHPKTFPAPTPHHHPSSSFPIPPLSSPTPPPLPSPIPFPLFPSSPEEKLSSMKSIPEAKKVGDCCFNLLNQVHFAQCSASQNPDKPRSAAKKRFFCKRAKREDGKTNLTFACRRARGEIFMEYGSRTGLGKGSVGKGD